MTFKELIKEGGYEQFIREKGKLVYAMLRKKFPQFRTSNTAITEEDVIAHSVLVLFEKFLDENIDIVEKLFFATAKNYALNFFTKGMERSSEQLNAIAHDSKLITQNSAEGKLMKEDIEALIKNCGLSCQQQFIVKNYINLEFEKGYEQKEILEKIQEDYLKKFKAVLTIDNYRTLKKRGLDKLRAFG